MMVEQIRTVWDEAFHIKILEHTREGMVSSRAMGILKKSRNIIVVARDETMVTPLLYGR